MLMLCTGACPAFMNECCTSLRVDSVSNGLARWKILDDSQFLQNFQRISFSVEDEKKLSPNWGQTWAQNGIIFRSQNISNLGEQ